MEEWKEYKLGEFMQFNPKERIAKGQIARKIAMDLLVPYCRDVVSNLYEEYKGGAKFRNGDTIMARITPCLENGKTSYISSLEKDEVAFGSTEYIVLRNIEGVSDSKFVYYLSVCPQIREVAIKSMVGSSGRQRVQQDVLENYCMNLPSLPTQQKIANILSSLDDKIEVNRRINEQLEELAQALFKSWFVDFEPFKDGEFVDSELGMIPKGWKVGTLGELCITNKRTYGAKFANEIAYIDTGSVTKNQIEGFQILNPEVDKIPSRARRAVTEGDILFSSVRPNQKHYAFLFAPQTNMVASTGFIVITANWSGYRYFIYLYLIQEEIIDKLQAIAEQSVSTYPSINASDITNLKLVIPPMDIIGKFAGMNLAFMSEIDKNQQEIHHLTTLRDTLLPKLMSGEIDVNEVTL